MFSWANPAFYFMVDIAQDPPAGYLQCFGRDVFRPPCHVAWPFRCLLYRPGSHAFPAHPQLSSRSKGKRMLVCWLVTDLSCSIDLSDGASRWINASRKKQLGPFNSHSPSLYCFRTQELLQEVHEKKKKKKKDIIPQRWFFRHSFMVSMIWSSFCNSSLYQ